MSNVSGGTKCASPLTEAILHILVGCSDGVDGEELVNHRNKLIVLVGKQIKQAFSHPLRRNS